ncbi:hypothetical protein BSKO_10961 [Bryopsis sp. KO-2023]|nr:hypothetical protein BSKO_10961 [Bryopsis sp. KO-2023]
MNRNGLAPTRRVGGVKPDLPSPDEAIQIPPSLSERVTQLIQTIRPAKQSEQRRHRVANFVRNLISKCFAPDHKVEAFMFGSVPLRTYLPDGDIDASIFCEAKGLQDIWGDRLQAALEKEANNPDATFKIANVQLINAEVKLLKCLVDNMVVDMSFNQIGGLCTLNFLEAMDRKIGGNHLFKRSIILIKAWCYYESRVLGAQYSLLSTYALETMVLYIFNVHHAVLETPLEVLYKFLMVFHQFEWDKYCLTLSGPVPLKNLEHDPVMPPSENGTLLTANFMKLMLESYSYTPVVPTNTKGPAFPKFINIMDPLLHTNNLGRSVSKTSEIRIRNAFGYAAGKLAAVFKRAKKDLPGAMEDLDKFFKNTWKAQGRPRPSPSPNRPPSASPTPIPTEEHTTPEQAPKDLVETSSLGHPTPFPGFPGVPPQGLPPGLQVANAQAPFVSTYPQPPPPPPAQRPSPTEELTRRGSSGVQQVHPPPPPGPPPTQPALAAQPNVSIGMLARPAVGTTVQPRPGNPISMNEFRNFLDMPGLNTAGIPPAGVGDAVIGTAVGQVEDRAAMEAMAGVGVSGNMQLPGFDQWGMFNPWLMAQPLLLQVAPCYPVQQQVAPSQESHERNKTTAAPAAGVAPAAGARQEGTKPLLRVRSAPNLGEILPKRRDRNLNRRVMHPHPLPYPRKWPAQGEFDEDAQLMEGAQQGGNTKTPQVWRDGKTGLILPSTLTNVLSRFGVTQSSRMIPPSIKLDDKVRAKLEKIEKDAKRREALENAKNAVAGASTSKSGNEPITPSAEEPPDISVGASPQHSAMEASGGVMDRNRVRRPGGSAHPERNHFRVVTGKQADMAQLQQADLNASLQLQVGNLVGANRRMMGNRGQVTPERQMQNNMVELGPNGEIIHHPGGYHVYPGVYLPGLAQVHLTPSQIYGAMGLSPQLAVQQVQRQAMGGRNVAGAQKATPGELVDHTAALNDFFGGANYQPSVMPMTYLNNRTNPVAGSRGNINMAEAVAHMPALAQPGLVPGQHSPPSGWGYVHAGGNSPAVQPEAAQKAHEPAHDSDDVLEGDIEVLTKHLEAARNCVGRKPERNRTTGLNGRSGGAPLGGRTQQRMDGTPSGSSHQRKRHQHGEDNRGYGQHGQHGQRPHGGGYEHRSGRAERSQERQPQQQHASNAAYQNDAVFQVQAAQAGYSPMMYQVPAYVQPPPPPPAGGSDPQVVPLGTAEEMMFQLHSGLTPHPAGFYLQPSVGGPVVAGAPVGSPGLMQTIPVNTVAGLPAQSPPVRRDGQGNSRGNRSQYRGGVEPRTSKPLSLSTDDGTRVEIDPSVIQAVEAALAGTVISGEVGHRAAVCGHQELHQPPQHAHQHPTHHPHHQAAHHPQHQRDDHHRNPPADTISPRSVQSKSTDGGSAGSNGSQRGSARKRTDTPHTQQQRHIPAPSAQQQVDTHSLQNPPVIFGGVAPGSVDALTFLAAGAQTVKGGGPLGIPFETNSSSTQGGQHTSTNTGRLIPNSQGDSNTQLISRAMQQYGTGGYFPISGPHFADQPQQKSAVGGRGEAMPSTPPVIANGGDPPGSRASADGDMQSVPDGDHMDDGSWSSNSIGSDRGGDDARPHHHPQRRYGPRYGGNRPGGSKGYHDYSSRPPRHYRSQNSYWNGGDQWQRSDRPTIEYCQEYSGAFYYPDARVHGYGGGGYSGGYMRPEQEFDQDVYPQYDQQRNYRGGYWKGVHRRDKEDGRWNGFGREEKRDHHHTDRSSTPDSQGSHNTVHSQGRNLARRETERWESNRRYGRAHRRTTAEGLEYMAKHGHPNEEHNGRGHHPDQSYERRSNQRGNHHPHGNGGVRSSHDRHGQHRSHHRRDEIKPKTFTFQEEDFPALEATRPQKVVNTVVGHIHSGAGHRGTPKAAELNPMR